MLRGSKTISRPLRTLTSSFLPNPSFCISSDQSFPTMSKKTLKLSRRVSLSNRHLNRLNVLVLFFFFFFLGMMTKFSKAKLAKIQEKKAKGDLTGSLLTRKCQRDTETPKDNPMVTSPVAKSVPQCLASPSSSLELIASTDGGSKAKGKDKAPLILFGTMWGL